VLARKRVELGKHRHAEAMESRERQFHLCLDTRDLLHSEPSGPRAAYRTSAVLPIPASPRMSRTAL
jgi:hypothetical protein